MLLKRWSAWRGEQAIRGRIDDRSADERMSDLVQIYVERDIAYELGLGQLVSEFAACTEAEEALIITLVQPIR